MLKLLLDKVNGYKTYITGAAMVVHGLLTMYLNGHPDQVSQLEVLNGLGLIFIRHAISKNSDSIQQ